MSTQIQKKDKTYTEYRLYKPTKTGNGAASKLQLKVRNSGKYPEPMLFWVSAPQKPSDDENAAFKWNDKTAEITMKLGEPDIAAILALLTGKRESVKLYHQNDKGNTTLSMSYMKAQDKYPDKFGFKLSKQGKEDKTVLSVSHFITIEEGEILRVLLESAIKVFFGWH